MKISFDESKNIIPSGRKHYTCNYCIDHFKTKFVLIHQHPSILQSLHTILKKKICFDASHNVPTCRKQYSCKHCIRHLQTKFVLIHQRRSKYVENSILAIIAYNTSKTGTSNLAITLTIFKKKFHFDSSEKVPTYRKQYSCNHCIQYLKRKFVLSITQGSNIHKIVFLQSMHLSPPN